METPGSHFRSPTTLLSPSRLQELADIVEQASFTQEQYRAILNEVYKSLKRESPVFSELKQNLQNLLQAPNPVALHEFLKTRLIPEPSSSDTLRKKRKQTPRRRYTIRKKYSK